MKAQTLINIIVDNEGEVKLKNKASKVVFWGVAPTGDIHIGYLPSIGILKYYKQIGAKIIIFIGDYHAYLDAEKTEYKNIQNRSDYYKKAFLGFGFAESDIIKAKDVYTQKEYIETLFQLSNYLPHNELAYFADKTLRNFNTNQYTFGDFLYVATQIIDIKFFNVDLVLCGLDEAGIYRLGLPILQQFDTITDFMYLGLVPGVNSAEMHASNNENDKISIHDRIDVIQDKLQQSPALLLKVKNYILPIFGYPQQSYLNADIAKIIYSICNP